jgi:transcriptional regulator with XRE-family HTH domain
MTEKIGVYIGKRVLELREHRGLTQKDLAAAAGVPQPHISQLERGLFTDIQVSTLLNLAQALRVKHTTLLPEHLLRPRRRGQPAADPEADIPVATIANGMLRPVPTCPACGAADGGHVAGCQQAPAALVAAGGEA